MTEVQELLAQALTELPGGPIAAPVGLGVKARRRARRRRQAVIGASVAGVLAIGGGATVALRPAPVSHEAVGRPVPAFCVGQPSLGPAPDGARPRHSATEAEGAFFGISQLDRGGARGATTLLQRDGHLVWSVELLQAPERGGLRRVLWLFPDADLMQGIGSVTCGLPPQLVGATVDPLTSAGDWSDRPSDLAVEPVTAPLAGESSLPWTVANAGPESRELKVSYGTGCHEDVRLQVEQAPAYVLLRVVRRGGPSSDLCLTGERGFVRLDAPLGQRLLLHAALTGLRGALAARLPTVLPPGARSLGETVLGTTTGHRWALPHGRILTLVVGGESGREGLVPLRQDGFVAGFPVYPAGINETEYLEWTDDVTPCYVSISRHGGRADLPMLRAVAESLYTQEYVGLTVDEAHALASSYGLAFRVVREDGHDLGGTLDLKVRRVNVAVDAGRVTAVESYS